MTAAITTNAMNCCGSSLNISAEIKVITVAATCSEAGEKRYTATVEFGGEVYTDTVIAPIDTLPHTPGEPERENILTQTYLRSGNRDLMWQHPDMAESYLVQTLRKGSDKPMDYINLAHCLMLKGDRMMAFENYKQARQLCKSSKEFFGLFRPDRRQLVDCGVPVEQIYLIEDKLL